MGHCFFLDGNRIFEFELSAFQCGSLLSVFLV